MSPSRGPLDGARILEVGGIGPAPFAGMLLADMGASVLRVDRRGGSGPSLFGTVGDPTLRGRASLAVDLKAPTDLATVAALADAADALIEGYRPGVMERLGLGPDELLGRNPRLVYGRMTGFGQDGPLSHVAGHDITYTAVAGSLGACARQGERPLAPLNLVGDFGGGAMLLAFGVVCGVLEARGSGRGQVVDAAMVDGAALLTTMFHAMRAGGTWSEEPGTNVLDSGAPFYETYATRDGGHVAVGALEPQFYARLLELIGIPPAEAPQWDRDRWPELKERFAATFATRTRREWSTLLEHEDVCVAAVQGLGEAPSHPHMAARGTFVEIDGVVQPAAAPRFDRTPGAARPADHDPVSALAGWGLDAVTLAAVAAAA